VNGAVGARWTKRRRQRGSISILFALCLLFIIMGFVALVVDVGHFWQVRSELQNAADSAALAGARDLNGTSAVFGTAVQSSRDYGAFHRANNAAVNVPASDVTLGHWDFNARTFTATQTPAPEVNAVKVVTRRTAATGNAVTTFFAPFLGVTEQDVTATAIAVGGSPKSTCGFPMAVPDCSLFDGSGNIACNAQLQFNTNNDNIAFTLMSSANPNTPDLECAMAKTLGYTPCPTAGGCNCAQPCNATSTENGDIRISNGNNFSNDMITYINWAVTNAGGAILVQMPVIKTNLTSNCTSYVLTGDQAIAGYVAIRITGATFGPPKQVLAEVDCTQSGAAPPSSGFYGYKSQYVYIAQ
jgi:Flp pilus assembly protein TadG